jgi:hypothetical protein
MLAQKLKYLYVLVAVLIFIANSSIKFENVLK